MPVKMESARGMVVMRQGFAFADVGLKSILNWTLWFSVEVIMCQAESDTPGKVKSLGLKTQPLSDVHVLSWVESL